MADMLGYSVEEMQGRFIFDFMDEEKRTIAAKHVEHCKSGISEQHDFKLINKEGLAVWAELNTTPLYDTDGTYNGALAMITDITQRRRAEKKLRDTQQLLLRTESLAQVGSWDWDIKSGDLVA